MNSGIWTGLRPTISLGSVTVKMPELPLGWIDFNLSGPVALTLLGLVAALFALNSTRRRQPSYQRFLMVVLVFGLALMLLWLALVSYGLFEKSLPLLLLFILSGMTALWLVFKFLLDNLIQKTPSSQLPSHSPR